MIRLGICGFGYWGPNLLRTFAANPGFTVAAVADRDEFRLANVRQGNAALRIHHEADELIDSPELDAVAIATPSGTHYELASRALRRRKHVLVEKPMCTSVAEGRELMALAEREGRVLMVDQTYLFHSVVRKLKELKRSGALGTISYYDSLRINLGLFQPDLNVLWDLAPHDFSIMGFILEEEPVQVEATGYCHINPHLPDIVYVTVHYASKMIAHLNLSWMSPVKVRRIAIGGSKRMAVWDDLDLDQKLRIYDSGIEVQPEDQRNVIMPSYRIGDVHSPRVSNQEPLVGVVEHFRRVIAGEERSILDGRMGLKVVELLEMSQRALDISLRAVDSLRGFDHDVRAAR